ncbi:hypothetical protein [Roseomonas sp. CECT 9278]|uniref:hypothetical protein n=1 Tax=Roseomonas sp. CECT 9278 TaxID=2845823 RepID=UPI001E54F23C|nr:hypothetical protein [Roseomonas sp. CECT 9278]CAH0130827.1 hypothetical protein ROS9278_00234 [Roseomonas sp. CECT 9278]
MGDWGEDAAAWAVFLASHMLPARPALLDARRRRRWGEARFAALQPQGTFRAAPQRLFLGMALWLVLVSAHVSVIGVSSWPVPP